MKCKILACLCVAPLVTKSAGISTFLRSNSTNEAAGPYGKPSCPCVGIDNLKGYYATQQDAYHVQYPAEAGASCSTWDSHGTKHPECRGGFYDGPEWCRQSWCYVDPCNCHLDVLPKMTNAGIEYQGSPAYWSYNTCGGMDFYSQEMNKDACIMQKTESACSKNPDCAWNGELCGGKEAVSTCKNAAKKDESKYGQEDCRCIGIGGRHPGKAFMYINEQDLARYDPNVGSRCEAWEMDAHPQCLKDGEKPGWCSLKWCFVDPCKCKTKVPPKAVSGPNQGMMFQGKLAHWSAETCGNEDTWSSSNSSAMGVVDDATAELCKSPLPGAAHGLKSSLALLMIFTAVGSA